MASVLALISKAVYEKLPVENRLSSVVPLDRYTSRHPAFDKLGPSDAIFLVTVRKDGPYLVAILDAPKRKGDALVGATNTTPLAKITKQIGRLKLADGKGITATLDKLGMSLQTPRVLADEDVALLRGTAPKQTGPAPVTPVAMKVPAKQTKASAQYPKLKGGKLSARAAALVEQVYQAPDDRALRGVLADQLLEDQHVWGELISLQMSGGKQHRERIEQIIRQHAREIVGEIANVAARPDLEIVDGFLVAARCAKSKSFTSADQRMKAAKAPQWATVKTVTLTFEMPGPAVEALMRNPASSNLTQIEDGWNRKKVLLRRATPRDAWQILDADCESILLGLPDAELARIPVPSKPAAREVLEKVRAKRAAPAKTPAKKKKRR